VTINEAKKLKLGDRVRWIPRPGDEPVGGGSGESGGVVDDVGYSGVRIRWDDGVHGHILFRGESMDLDCIHREPS
jgi:hypothetical protein